MKSPQRVILSPRQLELYDILTVSSATESFNEISYTITDVAGRMMRKGVITKGINEFKLCIVGFKSGVYQLSMGQTMEQFTVI